MVDKLKRECVGSADDLWMVQCKYLDGGVCKCLMGDSVQVVG